jgi:hypothetical protein
MIEHGSTDKSPYGHATQDPFLISRFAHGRHQNPKPYVLAISIAELLAAHVPFFVMLDETTHSGQANSKP